jgi:hypothetical protein
VIRQPKSLLEKFSGFINKRANLVGWRDNLSVTFADVKQDNRYSWLRYEVPYLKWLTWKRHVGWLWVGWEWESA